LDLAATIERNRKRSRATVMLFGDVLVDDLHQPSEEDLKVVYAHEVLGGDGHLDVPLLRAGQGVERLAGQVEVAAGDLCG